MGSLLNQLNFLDSFTNKNMEKKKNKKKKRKKSTATTTQLSIFEIVTKKIEKEKHEVISTKPEKTEDFKLTDKVFEKLGGIKSRLIQNMSIIKLIKSLKSKSNLATFWEQEQLAKFTGFGSMQEVFDDSNEKFEKERLELKTLLTPEEYKSARQTVNTAFYTDKTIISFMYNALGKLGFKGGDVLEPSCGIGNFFGLMPKDIKDNSVLKGVEIDTLTGELAKQLYQNADIEISPFEESLTYDGYYDVVIGNVPFGNFGVFDKKYNKYSLSIHNYFIVKSLDKLREGGFLAVVTSKHTMDSKSNIHREIIQEKAKVIACFRLPKGAFKEYARTDAVTDIIILQKTTNKNFDKDTIQFLSIDDRGINNYYKMHPDHILGDLREVSGMFGKELVPILENDTLENKLSESLSLLPANIYYKHKGLKEKLIPANNFDVKPGGYDFVGGKLVQNQNGTLVEVEKVKNTKNLNMYKDFIDLKKYVHYALQSQVRKCSDDALKEIQCKLNVMYDRFVYNYQYIDSKSCKQKFKEDPDYPLLCALEIHKDKEVKKADIFYKRTIGNEINTSKIETAKDALSYCLNEYGYVNMDFIKKIYKKEEVEILDELNELLFLDPKSNKYVISNEYLSGNVAAKLKEAKSASELNDKFKLNVEALSKVQPIKLAYDQIEVKLGTTFIPLQYYTDFVHYILDVNLQWKKELVNVTYVKELDEYSISGSGVISYSENYQKWGTERKNACELISQALNSKTPKVYDKATDLNGKEIRVLNQEETLNAETKQQSIKDEFKNWIYQDMKRRESISDIYNELYNGFVDKNYNGIMLKLPGKNPEMQLRDYQNAVISRGVIENNSLLLFHHVGAGKSFAMMAMGMELKRLGICNKPLYVVPNHMVQSGQFYKEFLYLYPNAKLLAATSDDFAKDKRMKLVSKIATCDWDGIIIGHSSLIKIPVSKDFQCNLLENQMDEIEEAIMDHDDKMTVKRLETILKNQKVKLQKLKDLNQDNTINFEELGVDQLFIDEAHNFKNLFNFSKMSNVAGVQNTSAQKTEDLYSKIQYIYNVRGEGKGVVFATGTPVSNSMSELYVMQRYLQPQVLKKQGIDTFDRWASTFGEVINSIEISPTGKGFKQKKRFAKFYNIPELTSIFRQCADVVLKHQLKIPMPNAEYHKIEIPAIQAVTNYINNELLPRAEAIAHKRVAPDVDNMLKVTNDGRKAALDIRLIYADDIIDGPTKISVCSENAYKLWKQSENKKGTQLIFCDLGTPKTSSNVNISKVIDDNQDSDVLSFDETDLFDDSFYDIYHEIQKNLIEKGVPLNEIAFIHDAKTPVQRADMVDKFKEGELRILLGSTSKMGEGMNCQNKIVAIHHIDVPWKPSSLEQRDGRGIRFGNENENIDIYRYVTKGTFDAFSWQTIQTKATFIGQVLCGMSNERSVDDVDVQLMSFAEMKAAASDNPLILKKFELEVALKKLYILEKSFTKNKFSIESKISNLEANEKMLSRNIIAYKKDVKQIKEGNPHILEIDGEAEVLNLKLIEKITPKIELLFNNEEFFLGEYLGLKMYFSRVDLGEGIKSNTLELKGNATYRINFETQLSLLRQLSGFKEKLIDKKVPKLQLSLTETTNEIIKLKNEYDKPFIHSEALAQTREDLNKVNKELNF